jgi:transposase
VVLVDESGFMLQPLVRRTWAEKGQTPVIDQWDRRDRISVITALTLSVKRQRIGMFFRLLDHNAKAEDFIWFLNDLRKELQRKLIVVWDNLGAHRRAENTLRALDCRWVRFERLPPYAPELNPVEHVWTTAKWGHLANAPPADAAQLWNNVTDELKRQTLEQRILRGHFHWAGLDLG